MAFATQNQDRDFSDFSIEIVPTEGTRLPIDRSGDFGASPFFGQLYVKQGACRMGQITLFWKRCLSVSNVR